MVVVVRCFPKSVCSRSWKVVSFQLYPPPFPLLCWGAPPLCRRPFHAPARAFAIPGPSTSGRMLAHRQLVVIGTVAFLGPTQCASSGIAFFRSNCPFDAAGSTWQFWLPLGLVLGRSAAVAPADPPGLVQLKLTGSWWRIPETVQRAMATRCGMCV